MACIVGGLHRVCFQAGTIPHQNPFKAIVRHAGVPDKGMSCMVRDRCVPSLKP